MIPAISFILRRTDLVKRIFELEKLITHNTTARNVVKHILGRPIEWIDSSKMSPPDRKMWSDEAKALLNNKVFISLVGRTLKGEKSNGEIAKNIMEHIARYAENYDQVKDMRMTLNACELIREMVEAQVLSDEQSTKDNLYSAI